MTTRLKATVALALAAAAAVVAVLLASGGAKHELRAVFTSAIGVVPGEEVRIGGVRAGAISSVQEHNGEAVLGLRVDDSGAWPLHAGTRAELRYGTTVSYAARYVELYPGPRSAPTLPSGGLLTTADTTTPVEFDDIFNIFRGQTRSDLRSTITAAGQALDGEQQRLAAGIHDAGPGLSQVAELLHRLGDDPSALSTLASAGAQTTAALAGQQQQLTEAVTGMARTFAATASQSNALTASLARYPATLRTADSTLGTLDSSLTHLDRLVGDLAPGAAGLRALAPGVRSMVATLDMVSPELDQALAETTASAPSVSAFLNQAGPFLTRFGTVSSQLEPMLACVRPYAPELTGFLSTWAGFTKDRDAQAHYWRTLLQAPPSSDVETRTSAQFVAQTPGATYALTRPPGLNAGQSWFVDSCGANHATLDASKDPEAHPLGGSG